MCSKVPCGAPDEERLTEDIIELARSHGRYGYRMVTGMLNNAGWHVNHKRVERIWRRRWHIRSWPFQAISRTA